MARMLIYVGKHSAMEKYKAAGFPVLESQKVLEALRAFIADPDGRLVVRPWFVFGYHVPADTFLVFDSSWHYGPQDPMTLQAKARVGNKGRPVILLSPETNC